MTVRLSCCLGLILWAISPSCVWGRGRVAARILIRAICHLHSNGLRGKQKDGNKRLGSFFSRSNPDLRHVQKQREEQATTGFLHQGEVSVIYAIGNKTKGGTSDYGFSFSRRSIRNLRHPIIILFVFYQTDIVMSS